MRRSAALSILLSAGLAGSALAQATGMPSFDAPYRAFIRHEFGGTISFPSGGTLSGSGTGLEGQYRFGYQTFDVGMRAGVFDPGGLGKTKFLIGASARDRVLTHSEQFPLDGAIVIGLGGSFVSGANAVIIPAGLSLGRRIDVKDSPVSVVPYGEPVLYILGDNNSLTDVIHFAVGFGADFRLSKMFDARVSVGLGDIEGVSVSAVWVH